MLLAGVNYKQRAGQALHFANTAQVGNQLFALVDQLDNFLLGQHVELAVLLHAVDLVQTLDAGFDGLIVGQHAAQPAVVDIIHVAALGFAFNAFLSLLLGAHEQDGLAFHRQIAHKHVRFVDLANGLLQVDDVNTVALSEDVLSHLGVPAAGLMTEVYAGFQQVLHRNDSHGFPPCFSTAGVEFFACQPIRAQAANRPRALSIQLYHRH